MLDLSAFGVAATSAATYLYDMISDRIVAEGPGRLVRDRVEAWNEVAPARYRAASADDLSPGELLEWQRFKADHQAWVISDES